MRPRPSPTTAAGPAPAWAAQLEVMSAARALAAARDAAGRIERARALIDRSFASPLDLDEMARAACLSRYHFLREFRRAFGETPHRYLTHRRIDRARELLASTRLSVTEVCLEVGFESLGSFSTLFRRFVGKPPSHYRRRVFRGAELARAQPHLAVPGCFLGRLVSAPV